MNTRYTALGSLLLLLPVVALSAEDWWVKTGESLPSLISNGYSIIGFSSLFEPNRLMDVKVNRYVLQKETSVYLCIEKLASATADVVVADCYALKTP